jgi:hypothetical protein
LISISVCSFFIFSIPPFVTNYLSYYT